MNYKLLRFSFLTVLCVLFGGGIYAITNALMEAQQADPEVTLDFTSQSNWNIPTSGTNKDLASFTNSDETCSIKLYATTNYKLNNGYLILGKKDSYLELPAFNFDVEKIEVTGTSGASTAVKQNIYVGDDAVSAETTGASADGSAITNTYEIASDYQAAGNIYKLVVTSSHNTQISYIKVYKKSETTDNRTATTVTFADGYATSGAVDTQIDLPTATVKAGDNPINATVTWSSGNENVAEIVGTKINLKAAGTAVITASYAGDNSNKPSNASYTVTAYAASYTSLAALQEAVTATSTPVQITFNNVYVTKVSGSNAYLADADGYGALIYTSGHGLTEGKVLNGTTIANLVLYNGYTELAGFSSAGLEITDGEYTPIVKTIDALTTANQCAVVTLKNVTYDATNEVFSDGTNTIKYYDKFSANPTLDDGAAYDVTGIVVLFKSNNEIVLEISPRTAADVVEAATVDPAGFRDIVADLTSAALLPEGAAQWDDVSTGIAVAEDGTLSRIAKEGAAIVFNGKWHGTQYGWANFSATVPVEGCVKITLGGSNYGSGAVTVTDSEGATVATIDNHISAMWSANSPDNVAVGYYRTNAATVLSFSTCDYLPYFAVEAIDEADLPVEVNNYNITFAAGEGVSGTVPAALEVAAGGKFTAPVNYTLYKEGYTLNGWESGDAVYLPGQEVTPEADMTLTAHFVQNEVSLADRTAPVTLTYNLSGYNDYPKYNFEGKNGIMVTQATVNGQSIDVKVDVNATSGKFSHNGSGWHQVNAGTKVTVPSCKGAVISVGTYNDATGTSMTFAGNNGSVDNNVVSYTATAGDATCEIAQVSNNYWNNLTVTLPVVEQGGDDPTETGVLYSWESPEGTPIETGGVAKSYNGDTETTNDPDNSDINAVNSDYHVLRLRGNATFTTNFITITLDNALKAGDKINITAYRNKNAADKKSGALIKFEKGSEQVRTDTSDKPGLEFVNIDTSDESAADQNRGTEPNTIQLTVPESAAGSTTLSLTRAQTGTNLFITKLTIETTESGGDEPVEQDVTATWDFAGNCANLAPKSEGGTYTETTMASDVEGISMNIVYNNGQIKNNDNSYQVTTGVEMQIPVKNAGDVVTVVGYPDSNYSHYSVAGTEATEPTTEYTAKTADAAQGYVSVVSTNGNNYYLSISVLQKAQSSGPDLVEKSIYKTDFSEWEELTASQEESNVAKTTKYTNENLNFTFYNTGVNTGDYDETKFPNNNGYRIFCPKNAGGYVTTSALANITKVRFIHGATGSSRGYKLEAKGDGDEDWVVVSDSYASPNGWCEVTKPINKTNCQLRFTNLAETQYAYIFELEIFGNVDLSGAPLLETMTANGKTYNADDIFEMANSGNYEATIELASSETMPSAENPVTATAANGEIGTITYATEEGNTIVTIPVTADNNTANYVATFTRKPMLTLTYIGVDGTELGTQPVEKDAPIGEFAVDIENVSSSRNGYKARGWFKQNYVGEKYTTASTFSENANLYAVETEIEVPSTSRDYEFNLADQFFYAEDHEAFSPQEGASCKFHDTTHGWSVYNGDKIDLLVGPKAIISVATCKYGALDNILVKKGEETLATLTGKNADVDGEVASYTYEGEEGTLTLEMAASGEGYIHSVKIANIAETNYEKDGNWFMVKAGDVSSLIDALEVANGASGNDRQFIFLPNGTYDLGTTVMTTISGSNISLIGESMEGVIIKNRPVKEGINDTPTLVNTGSNNYFQDLTIDCLAPWGGSAERGVALSDKGNNTICKNVYLKGLQDTYVSNNANGTYYFEDGKIEGSVDYVCGYGDVYFNKVRFYTVNKSTGATGGCIAAPNTLKSFGYIFNECTLDGMANEDGKYRLARPWAENTIVRMLNTTMIIKPNAAGWGEWNPAHAVVQFAEYNSLDADGNAVDVSQRATTIGGQPNNPVITAEEAATYAPEAIFAGEWKPFDLTVQCEAPEAELKDGTITWTPADNGAIAYMVSKNGQMMAITTGTSFVIDAVAGNAPRRADAADKYTIRAANPRGGFGEAKEVKETATGINTVKNGQQDDTIYNMQGVRVNHVQKGVYIVNGKKVVIK